MITNERSLPTPITAPNCCRSIQKTNENKPIAGPAGLVHNHPSGDPTPSQADIHMTQSIVGIAKPLGIAVHDHIIVGKDGHASLRGMKLI